MPPEAEPWAVGILAGVNLLPLCVTLFSPSRESREFSLGIVLPASNSSLFALNKVKETLLIYQAI